MHFLICYPSVGFFYRWVGNAFTKTLGTPTRRCRISGSAYYGRFIWQVVGVLATYDS